VARSAAAGGGVEPGSVRASSAARDEHDRGSGRLRGEALGHREAVHTGQLDVEQYNLRAKAASLLHGRLAVGCFPEHVEPVGLQQRSRAATEAGVVIHDQD
jgi:hypothetical protein